MRVPQRVRLAVIKCGKPTYGTYIPDGVVLRLPPLFESLVFMSFGVQLLPLQVV